MDKFYTKNKIVSQCMTMLEPHVKEASLIIEPSAGAGAFIRLRDFAPTLFIDIAPDHPDVVESDFLTYDIPGTGSDGRIAVVGNPPFGRQSSMAKKFIKRASEFAYLIAFILPKSFKKPSMQQIFPRSFHLVDAFDLEEDAFEFAGKNYDVPCVFQIWKRLDHDRELVPKFVQSPLFGFVKADKAQISIRRVGFYAGRATTDLNKSPQSHYFIRLNVVVNLIELCKAMNNYIYELNNTVGPRSLSKSEVQDALLASVQKVLDDASQVV